MPDGFTFSEIWEFFTSGFFYSSDGRPQEPQSFSNPINETCDPTGWTQPKNNFFYSDQDGFTNPFWTPENDWLYECRRQKW